MKKLYIDTDIILDVLTQREPHLKPANKLFSLIELKKFKAYTTPVVYANLFYILSRIKDKKSAIRSLRQLNLLVPAMSIEGKNVELALVANFPDFEDSLQYFTALQHKIDYIITRNKKDFKKAEIPVYTAKEFITLEAET